MSEDTQWKVSTAIIISACALQVIALIGRLVTGA